jgi:putative oxidoreductase
MIDLIRTTYDRFARLLNLLQSPLLLAVRLYWGWQFAQDGWGKVTHLDRVTQFFTSLNLPAPGTTALIIGLIELVGGILFALGLGSRLVSLVLFVNMTKPDDFYGASPYTYWFAALLILILGPGMFAIDWLLMRRFGSMRNG